MSSSRPSARRSKKTKISASTFNVEGLEARVLLSATPLPTPPVTAATDTAQQPAIHEQAAATTTAQPTLGGDNLFTALQQVPLSPGIHVDDQGKVTWVLSQQEITDLSAGKDIVYFGDEALSMHIVVGNGTDTPIVFSAPTTVLRGDTIRFTSPVIANELIMLGDGSTVFPTSGTFASISVVDAAQINGAVTLISNGTGGGQGGISFTGTINGQVGGATDSLTLDALKNIQVSGNVGDGNESSGPLQNFTIEKAENITFNGSFKIDGDLLIKKGQTINFVGAVDIGGSLTIEDGGAITFGSSVKVGGNLTVNKAASLSFGGSVKAGGNIAIGNSANYNDVAGTVQFSLEVDFEGTGTVFSKGGITFSRNIGSNSAPDSLRLGSAGAIAFNATSSVNLGSSAFIVENATSVVFTNAITAGSITIGSTPGTTLIDAVSVTKGVSGNITFGGSVTADSIYTRSTGANAIALFSGTTDIGAGGATVVANNIDFGLNAIVRASNAAATLTLKPYDVTRALSIGSVTGSTGAVLQLNNTDLVAIRNDGIAFASVNFGDAQAGSGIVYLGTIGSSTSVDFLNPTHIFGGSIIVNNNAVIDVANQAGLLHLVARTGDITINGSINALGASSNARLLFQAAANITVNRAVYADDRISLVAGTSGTGNIVIDRSGANTGELKTLLTSGTNRRIELIAGETSGDIIFRQANITVASAVGALSHLVLRANNGAITTVTSGMLTASNLAFWAKNNVVINTTVDTISSETINSEILAGGSGAVITATIDASGAITGYNITNGGSGYTVAPTINILGDGRVVGTATTVIRGGVSTIFVTSGGSGYTEAPVVSFTGGSGTGATATAVVINGVVTAINVTGSGTNYQLAPTVVITPTANGGGTGAAARATINGVVTQVVAGAAGSGYTFTPTVVVTGGRDSILVNGGQMVGTGSVTIIETNAITVDNITTSTIGSGGALSLTATTGNISVGYINTFNSAISLTASAGAIVDSTPGSDAGSIPNVATSGTATFSATAGIGALGVADLDVALGGLNATNIGTGDIVISQLGIADRTLNITGLRNQSTSGGISINSEAQVVVPAQTNGGSVTINGAVAVTGSGNILIQAVGATSNLAVNSTVTGGTGSVSLLANNNFTQAAAGTISTTGTGTIDVEAQLGSITMVATATTTTTGGNIRYKAATESIIGVLDARTATDRSGNTLTDQATTWGDISVIAVGLSILDAKLAAGTAQNFYSRKLRLLAGTAVGTSTNSLESEAQVASVRAGAGLINLTEATALEINDVAVTVNRVAIGLTTATASTTDAAQSDVATLSADGSITVRTLAGNLTLNAGTANDALAALTAHGAGVITLDVVGALTINGTVSSTTGAISLTAKSIAQNANVSTTTGAVTYIANTTDIVQLSAVSTTTTTGAISFTAATDIGLSIVQSTSGALTLTATAGAITDVLIAETSNLISTGQATLTAANGIGTSTNDINTTLVNLQATNTATNGIYIRETDTLIINGTGLRTLAGDGSIQLDVVLGTLTVNSVVTAHGAGNIHLFGVAASASVVTTNAVISSTTGSLEISGSGIAQNAVITTGGAGTVAVTATAASITMADLTTTTSGTGAVTYLAAQNVLLSLITSTSGAINVTATAGSITDNTALEVANLVTTGTAKLDAATGIGATGASDIDTNVGTLTAHNRISGAIVIDSLGATTVGAAGVLNDVADQPIVITTRTGILTVNGPVTATGTGNILLQGGSSGSVIVSGATAIVSSVTGNITLLAPTLVQLTSSAAITTAGTGTIDLEADVIQLDNSSSITGAADVRLKAVTSAKVTGVSTTGNVTVEATSGFITDGGDTRSDITAANIRLLAPNGIGSDGTTNNALEITTTNVAAAALGTGGIYLIATGDVTVGTVAVVSVNRVIADGTAATAIANAATTSDLVTVSGEIQLTSTGTATLTDGVNADSRALSSTSGSIGVYAQTNVEQQANIVTGSTGLISVTAVNGSITMADLTRSVTATGSISYTANINVALSELNSTSGALNVTATTGALTDITALEASNLVTTGLATLVANTGIGTATAGDIDTTIGSLTATNKLSGGIFIQETDTLSIVGTGVQTQAGNGPISIVVTTGDLTTNAAISANGSGNVLLNAAGTGANILANAAISSGSGNLSLVAANSVTFAGTADLTVSSGTGTIDVEATAGSITTSVATLVTKTNGANIRFTAAQDVSVGVIDARINTDRTGNTLTNQATTWGNVAITALAGSITDAKARAGTAVNVYGRSARLVSLSGVGILGSGTDNALETELGTVAVSTATNGINIVDTTALTVGPVTGTAFAVSRVAATGIAAAATTLTDLEDARTTTSGAIVLRTLAGDLTIDGGTVTAAVGVVAGGVSNIQLSAAANVVANASVSSSGGNVSIEARGGSLTVNNGSDLTTTLTGTVELTATAAITLNAGTDVTTGSGNIRAQAGTSLSLGGVISTTGNVALTALAGSIIDLDTAGDTSVDIVANGLRLSATNGIGATDNAIETTVTTLTARAGAGGVFIAETSALIVDDVTVTVNHVNADSTTAVVTDAQQSDVRTTAGGAIVIEAAGLLTLNDGSDNADTANTQSVSGTGVVRLVGTGIVINSDVVTTASPITLESTTGTIENKAAISATTTGTLELIAATAINFTANATAVSGTGNIRLAAGTSIALTGISTGGNVTAKATAGSITDAGNTNLDIVANQLRLEAGLGVGEALNALDINVNNVAAKATTAGIFLGETNTVTIDTIAAISVTHVATNAATSTVSDAAALAGLVATTSNIELIAQGSITQNADVTTGTIGTVVVTSATGSITMVDLTTTTTVTGTITYTANGSVNLSKLTSTSGNLIVTATTGNITDNTALEASNLITTGRATLTATTGIGSATAGDIDTTIGELEATNNTSGGIFVQETNALIVAGTGVRTLAGNGPISLVVDTGALTVNSVITAHGSGNIHTSVNGGTFTSSVAISSTTGNISLSSTDAFTLNAAASVVTTGAGTIELVSSAANITQANGSLTSAGAGNIRLAALTNIALTGVTTTGNVTIKATNGSITDNGDIRSDVVAAQLRLEAGLGIGAALNLIDLDVANVAAKATTGGIYLTEANAITVDTIAAISVNTVLATALTSTTTDSAALSGLVATTSDIVLTAVGTITQNADVLTGTVGTVAVTSTTGSITMVDLTKTTTSTGTITYTANVNVALSLLTSTSGNLIVTATTGAITDNTALEASNLVTTGRATLTATTGIGSATVGDIDTTIGELEATNNTSGGIFIQETNALIVAGTGVRTLAGNGPISLVVDTGALTVNSVITAHGSGNIHTSVNGGTFTSSVAISSTTGNISLSSTGNFTLNAAASVVTTGTGTIELVSSAASITQTNGSLTSAGAGNIRLAALTDIALTGVTTTGNVTIKATNGSVTDNGDTRTDVIANQLRIEAGLGIGAAGNLIELNVANVAAKATTGGIYLTEANAITVDTIAAISVNTVLATALTSTTTDIGALSGLVATTSDIVLTAVGTITQNADVLTGTAGTVAITSTTGSITMVDLTKTTTANGSITYIANVDVALSLLTSTSGALNVTATTGTITDNTALEASNLVTTARATLNAATGIGSATAGDIDTTIGELTATNNTSGGIFIQETNALIIAGTGVRTLAGNGPISLVVDTGGLTVNSVITAHGSGNIHTSVNSGAFTSSVAISSTTGNISLSSSGTFTLNAAASVVTAGTGTIELVSSAANISQADGSLTSAINGNIRLAALTDIALTGVTTSGNVTIKATNGTITDAGNTRIDVVANQLRIEAGLGIGTALNAIDLTVANVAAKASTTGIYLSETNAVTIDTIAAISVNTVLATALTSTTTDSAALSGLVATTSDIVLTAGGTITQNANVFTGAAGTVSINATVGSITMVDLTSTTTSTGTITYTAAANVDLSLLTSTSGAINVTATAGTITDNTALEASNLVTTARATLVAATGIGSATAADIDTTIGELVATNNTSGGIFIQETNALTVAGTGVRTLGGNGPISLVVSAGNLLVSSVITANGTGRILASAADSITADAVISSSGGAVSVLAGTGSINLNANVSTTGTGTVDVSAGTFVTVSNTTNITAGSGNIRTAAGTNLTLGGVISTTGNVSLIATTGSITDGDSDAAVDVVANGLRLVAGNAIGLSSNAIETTVATLSAKAGAGGIFLVESNALVVDDVTVSVDRVQADSTIVAQLDATQSDIVTTAGGAISLTAVGAITINDGSANNAHTGISGTGVVFVTGTSLAINADVSTTSPVTLIATTGAITLAADVLTTTTGTIDLQAVTGIALTSTSDLVAVNGDIRVRTTTGNITLGGRIETTKNVSLVADAGSILDVDTDSSVDIIADGLRIEASGVVGATNNAIETTVAKLSVKSTGLFISETNDLTVTDVSASINRVAANATTSAVADVAISDLVVTGAGPLVLTVGGALTLNDGVATADSIAVNGTGVVRIAAGSLTANANITSPGAIQVSTTTGNLVLNADVTTSGTGTLNLASFADLTLNAGADVSAALAIRLAATGTVQIDGTVTTPTNVSIVAGAVQGTATTAITASGLRLDVVGAVGSNSAKLNTKITTLSARAGAGLFIVEEDTLRIDSVAVSVTGIADTAVTGTLTDAAQTDVRVIGTTNIKVTAGDLVMADGAFITASTGAFIDVAGEFDVSTVSTGASDLSLTVGGPITDILTGEAANFTGAKATVRAAGSFGTVGNDINTALSTLDVEVTGTSTIVITEADALNIANATTDDGLINVTAGGNLTLTSVAAGGTNNITAKTTAGDLVLGSVTADGDTINVTAFAAITKLVGTTANLTASTLALNAGTGIGAADTVLVATTTLSAVSTNGDIKIRNLLATDSTVTNIQTGIGDIELSQAGGSLTIEQASTTDGDIGFTLDEGLLSVSHVHAGGTGNVSLEVTGSGQVDLVTDITAGGGNIAVTTLDNILLDHDITTNGENLTFTGALTLAANITINTGGGNISFTEVLDGPFSLTIDGGTTGNVTFDSTIGGTAALTALTIKTGGAVSLAGVNVAGDTQIDSGALVFTGGASSVHGTGTLVLAPFTNVATIGLGGTPATGAFDYVINGTSLNAIASGFTSVTLGRADSPAAITIADSTFRNVTLIQSPVTGGSIDVTGTIAFSGTSLVLDTAAELSFSSTGKLNAGAATVTFNADLMTLNGTANSITGTGTLFIQPDLVTTAVTVGTTSSAFDLTIAELATIKTGFAQVVIGRDDATSTLTIAPLTLANPTTFRAPLGSITTTGIVQSTNGAANLTFNAVDITIGTGGTQASVFARSGSLNFTVNGGTFTIGNDQSQVKALGNVVIGSSAPSTINLRGQLVVAGALTVNITGDIITNTVRITSVGNVLFAATGDVDLRGGFVASQQGALTLTADSDLNGVGQLLIGTTSNTAVGGKTSVTLYGYNVAVGSSSSYGKVYSQGDLSVFTDALGSLTAINTETLFKGANIVRFGQTNLSTGTSANVNLFGVRIEARVLNIAAIADLTVTSIAVQVQNELKFLARNNLSILNGSVITTGGEIALYADVSRTIIATNTSFSRSVTRYPAP